jgi:hypothetical protein
MVKLQASDATEVPDLIRAGDIIDARLSKVTMREFVWDGETVQKLKWDFVVVQEGPWKGKTIFGDTSTTFKAHVNCKAYNWVTALTGKQYAEGEDMDTDDLIGLPARIMIMHKPDKQERVWMRVKEVFPPAGAPDMAPMDAPF